MVNSDIIDSTRDMQKDRPREPRIKHLTTSAEESLYTIVREKTFAEADSRSEV